MEKRLKQSLGIDVSKLKLSLSLGFLTGKLEKEFISHEDVSNDLSWPVLNKGYIILNIMYRNDKVIRRYSEPFKLKILAELIPN